MDENIHLNFSIHFQPPQQPQQPTPMMINILPMPSSAEPQMPMMPIAMAPSGMSMGMAPMGVLMVPVMHPAPPVIMMPSSRSSSRSSGVPADMAPSGMYLVGLQNNFRLLISVHVDKT